MNNKKTGNLSWQEFEGSPDIWEARKGPYRARIQGGRVWRWQVGDEREPARLMGRTTRGWPEAAEAVKAAIRLLELTDDGADVEGLPSGVEATAALVRELKTQLAERDLALTELQAELKAIKDSPLTVPAVLERYEALTRRAALRRKARLTEAEREELERLDYVASQLLHQPSPDSELVGSAAALLREAGFSAEVPPGGYDIPSLLRRLRGRQNPPVSVEPLPFLPPLPGEAEAHAAVTRGKDLRAAAILRGEEPPSWAEVLGPEVSIGKEVHDGTPLGAALWAAWREEGDAFAGLKEASPVFQVGDRVAWVVPNLHTLRGVVEALRDTECGVWADVRDAEAGRLWGAVTWLLVPEAEAP